MNFKDEIKNVLLAIDWRITPSVIEKDFKKIIDKIYHSLNSKIEHETAISISKEIESWACLFSQEVKNKCTADEKARLQA
jgi:multisubunit Na+/H+ antiporter MnhE subunit